MMRLLSILLITAASLSGVLVAQTENAAVEQTYPFPAETVQKALQRVGGFGGGALPLLDGFVAAQSGEVELYDRPYFQYRVYVKPVDANTTLVTVEAKISALRSNQDPAHPHYESLPSNGRLESDLHHRLQDELRGQTVALASQPVRGARPAQPSVNPQVAHKSSPSQAELDALLADRESIREKSTAVQAQIDQLRNARNAPASAPTLASVKKSGVGVMSRENFGGPVLFRAQAEDEFEVVQVESGWAQVRLTPDSTAYIQADELNLPTGIAEKAPIAPAAQAPATSAGNQADLGFSVSREDVSDFAGDWSRLKGKKVLFVYAQPRGLLSDMMNEDAKLGYAKRVFETRYRALAKNDSGIEGVVVVFLGNRGGVAAATFADIRQWIEGRLADDAFVRRCSLDPAAEFHGLRVNGLSSAH